MGLGTSAFRTLYHKKILKITFYECLAMKPVVGRMMAPEEVYVWLPGTCEYVTLYHSCDEVIDLEMGDYSGLPRWAQYNH